MTSNEKRKLFWSDQWLQEGPLLQHYVQQLEDEILKKRVCDYWIRGWGWDWGSFSAYLQHSAQLTIASSVLEQEGSQVDEFGWLKLNGRDFSVRSAYDLQQERRIGSNWRGWKLLWCLKIQSRVRVFIWLIARDRILTNYSRWRWKLTADPVCYLCGDGAKSTLHAIKDCVVARDVWTRFLPLRPVDTFFLTGLRERLEINLRHRQGSGRGAIWPEKMATICWSIWKWRNKKVFSHEILSLKSKISQIACSVRELEMILDLGEN